MSAFDLTDIFRDWAFDPEHTVRIVVVGNGRSVLQVRLPLGIEQYELDGRPDGERPRGAVSLVEHLQERLRRHIVTRGSDIGFEIEAATAQELQAEGVLYYYRYLLLFQINDHVRVVRDTAHNLQLCDLLEQYCPNEEQRNAVLQFRPYILRMNAAARAILASKGDLDADSEAIITDAIEQIESLPEIESPAFQFERMRSVSFLRSLARTLESGSAVTSPEPRHGDTGRAKLEQALREAIEAEDYEHAAQLRDRIRALPTD